VVPAAETVEAVLAMPFPRASLIASFASAPPVKGSPSRLSASTAAISRTCVLRLITERSRPKSILSSYHPRDVMALINAWLPLTFAMNCLNRSMGQPDLYPFVLSQEVTGKLGYIDALVHHSVAEVGDAR
jgi:hypothetical protein